jgi:hypothetical protein
MAERTVTIGVVSFTPMRMAFRCTFTSAGQGSPVELEIQEAREGLGGMLMKKERRGVLKHGGRVLQVRSVHDLQGSTIQLGTPIGYMFEIEDRPLGTVEINGEPNIRLAPVLTPEDRNAVILASLALSLLWDPAESALGREGS